MNRRKFISVTFWTSVGWAVNPLSAEVTNDPWKAKSVEDAIVALYGKDRKIIKSDKVKVKAPKLASNGASVPISIKSELDTKRVLVFQNVNPYALTGIFEVPKDALVDFSLKIKLSKEAIITVLIEDSMGNIYMDDTTLVVQMAGGCEG